MEKADRRAGETSLLEGPIFKTIVLFAVPILVSNLFQSFYNMVDTMIVGNILGDSALAAVGSTASIYDLLVGFGLGLGNGMAIVVARAFGSGNRTTMKKAVAGCLVVGLFTSVIVAVLGLIFLRPLLRLLNTPAEIMEEAFRYISVIILFSLVLFLYNLCASLLRAVGNSVIPLLFLIFSSCLNIGLDLLFIALLQMGVQGAAVATVLAQGISCVLCLIYIVAKTDLLKIGLRDFVPERALYSDLCGQGYAMAFMGSIVSVGTVILQYGINGLGTLIIAAHTAARKLFNFTAMPSMALSMGCSTFVSQNRGAGQGERILKGVKDCCLASIVMAAVMTVLLFFASEWIIRLISGSSEEVVIRNGALYLKINAPFYSALGILAVLRYSLQGIGSKLIPLISSVIEFAGKVLFVILFIPRFGYMAVIFCEPLIWVVMMLQLFWSYSHNPFIRETRADL